MRELMLHRGPRQINKWKCECTRSEMLTHFQNHFDTLSLHIFILHDHEIQKYMHAHELRRSREIRVGLLAAEL